MEKGLSAFQILQQTVPSFFLAFFRLRGILQVYMWDLGSTTELSVPARASYAAVMILHLVLYPDVLGRLQSKLVTFYVRFCYRRLIKNSHLTGKSEE